jgi:hypothetical protein
MARVKGLNKAQAIRDLLAQNGDMGVKDVISAMAKNGMKVRPNQVYFIKSRMRAKKRRQVRQAVGKVVSNAALDPLATIRKVKALASEVGGLGKLKALVEALGE